MYLVIENGSLIVVEVMGPYEVFWKGVELGKDIGYGTVIPYSL